MSGHSKWSTIKRKKAKVDAKKGAIFAQYAKEIAVAVKMGGPDLNSNYRLRTIVEKAKIAGVPNDNITRSISRSSGSGGGNNFDFILYEGYGPGGVAIIVEALTDNKNRTAGDIRSYFNKNKGNLGESGCVKWMFEEEGHLTINITDQEERDKIVDIVIDANIKDVEMTDESITIKTEISELKTCADLLESKQYTLDSTNIVFSPNNIVKIEDEEIAKYLLRLMDAIESHDDVQDVYANFDIDDTLIDKVPM